MASAASSILTCAAVAGASTRTMVSTSVGVVVSSSVMVSALGESWRRQIPEASARAWQAAMAGAVASTRTVSKSVGEATRNPALVRACARVAARWATRVAMARMPSAPWYTANMLAMTAGKTCEVQMLLVAFSRRMCCSRVCSARRNAVWPWQSRETPTRRPGILRVNSLRVAKNAACGPP